MPRISHSKFSLFNILCFCATALAVIKESLTPWPVKMNSQFIKEAI